MPNIIRQINTDDDYGTQKIRMIVQSNERGPAGPKGDTGEAATIAAGQAYSVEPGQSPAVMNTGTSSAAVFDFYIPKGEKGEKGDQGDPGPAGADEWGEIIGNIADQTDLQNALNGKQNKLTAGSNITIAGDTISATNTTYTAGNGLSLNHGEFSVNTGTIQSKLTAGSNVQINGSTISATDTTYSAGNAITIDSGNNNAINAAIDPADFFTSTENKLTGTGTSVTLTPTAGLPLDSVQLDGDTTQQTYSGKNLYLPIPKTSQDQGLILSYDSTTGECTISGTTTNTWSNFTSSQTCDLPAGTYTFSTSNPTTEKINFILQASLEGGGSESFNLGRDGTASLTKTINSKITSLRIWAGADSGKQINWAGTFQLESGSSSTSFEPYVGGIPAPNPDYPQEVQVVTGEQTVTITDGAEESQEYEVNLGKNLFDVSSITENTSPSFTGGKGHVVTFSANNDRAVILIKVEPNTSYTLSIGDTSIVNQIFIVGMQNTTTESGHSFSWVTSGTTIITGSNDQYIMGAINTNNGSGGTIANITNANVQLEKGSAATTYASYFTPIELCKIGTYQDYIYKSGGNWYVHKETGSSNVTSFTRRQNISTGKGRYGFALPTGALTPLNSSVSVGYGNLVPLGASGSTWDMVNVWVLSTTEGLFRAEATDPMTLGEANDWLTSHPFIIYYPLATATDTQITNADLITQLNALAGATTYDGQTIFTVTSDNQLAILDVETYRKSLAGIIAAIKES